MMKRATENLIDDHLLIEEAMDVMEKMIEKENTDTESLEFFVSFIREFADGCHHAKEEGLLFPKLIDKGIPGEQGPIGVMLREHELGRGYVKGMAENISLYNNGYKDALKAVYRNMTGYIELLRNHISKENNILFRMADNFLTVEEQSKLLTQFGQAEASTTGYEKKQYFIEKIKELQAVYQQ